MSIKAILIAITAATFSMGAYAQQERYSESADKYVEARYGTKNPDAVFDTQVKSKEGQPMDVDVGTAPKGHKFHRFHGSFMGGHDD